MALISVIVPTVEGREEHFKRCVTAYQERTAHDWEILTELDHPTVGRAWQAGANRAKGEYIALSCDDLEPLEGWDTAAVAMADAGFLPAPRVTDARNGDLQSRPYWGQEFPDGLDTGITIVPFLTRQQWEAVQPLFTGHYYCCAPQTRVLTAAMEWVEVGKLSIGDDLVGVDEFPGAYRDRKFRHAIVTGNERRFMDCLLVRLEDGREVTCSLDHPWLVKTWRRGNPPNERQAHLAWIEAGRLRPGDQISSPVRVWDAETSFEAGWLSGLFDGEGCAGRWTSRNGYPCTALSVSQNPGPVLDRAKAGLDAMGIRYAEAKNASGSRVTKLQMRSISDVMEVLGRLAPVRLRPEGLWEGASIRTKAPGQYATVSEVASAGRQEVAALGTSTGTFLAEGMVSHNSDDFISDRARQAGWPPAMCNGYAFKHHWAQHKRGAGMTEPERMTYDRLLYQQALAMVAAGQWDKPWPE